MSASGNYPLMAEIPYGALLAAFALAAGCAAESYETFIEEHDRLDCEITAVCDGEAPMCEDITGRSKDSCIKYRQRHADQCLADMEDWLQRVEGDTNQCTVFDSKACDEVTEWISSRRGCSAIDGRPLREAGQPVLAEIVDDDRWGSERRGLARHEAAGQRWLEIARYEHASIAAFSTVALQLLNLGAPPELIEGCHRAALDEVAHAKAALGLARALLDAPVDFGALPIPVPAEVSLRSVAVEALVEGCIGEGAAAARAHVAASRAVESIAEVWRAVAQDEARHAALAWSTLRWALERDPSLAVDLQRALEEARDERDAGSGDAVDLDSHGLLGTAEQAAIRRDVIDRLVAPLLGTMTRASSVPTARGTRARAPRRDTAYGR